MNGFKNEIRRKVTGFSAPLFVQNANNADFYESDPIQRSFIVEQIIQQHPDVAGFNPVAYKPGMIQSKNEVQEVIGLVFKGVDSFYDRSFLKEHLIAGTIPSFANTEPSNEIVLSSKICRQLKLKLKDEITALFVKNTPITRNFRVVGIYETGFEDYDSKLALCDIRIIQKLNDWGISGQLEVGDSMVNQGIPILLTLQGNPEFLLFDWGSGPGNFRGQLISPNVKDTSLQVKVYQINHGNLKLVDNHRIHLVTAGEYASNNPTFYKESLNLDDSKYLYHMPLSNRLERIFKVEVHSGSGTSNQFISGYEIRTKDWYQVNKTLGSLKKRIELIPTEQQELVKVVSIFDLEEDLFRWLAFLDINVQIIVTLMLLIGIINMGSALLILIIVRSNFIGLMKTMGAGKKALRRIFLIQAGYLIFRGLLFGNITALAIYFLQKSTGILRLNPEVYYLSEVPMELSWTTIVLLNIGTFVVCIVALMVPSYIISKVNPIKTIRFN